MGVSEISVDTETRKRIFPGSSELSAYMQEFDWKSSPLGPCETWPDLLNTTIGICLSSSFPMTLWWGPERITFYNEAYVSFLGSAKHPSVLGRPAQEVWSEIWTTIGPMINQVQSTGKACWSENTALYINRNIPEEEVYLTFSFSPITTPEGMIAGILCIATETSESVLSTRRLETLRKLSLSTSSFGSVKDACFHAISVLGDNLHDIPSAAIYVSDEVRGITRLTASFGLPRKHDLPYSFSGSDDPGSDWPMAQVLRNRTMAVVSERNGFSKSIVLPIPGNNETPAGLLVIGVSTHRVMDAAFINYCEAIAGHIGTAIRDAKRYQFERMRADTLVELDKSKTAFFSNVSHEFRTPLTLILAPLEEALNFMNDEKSPELRESIKMAHRNAMRLLRLVQTLLDFSRIESRRSTANYEPLDLSLLTSDLASIFRSAIERAGLEFRVHCENVQDPLYVDRDMWEKIVLNLISNAFKFTFKGFIEVSLEDKGDIVQLLVSDSGIGVSQDDMSKVFESFHRIEGGRARTYDGSGIGLALVKELVEMHGGTIQVRSREGEGSQFVVTLMKGYAHLPKDRINLRSKNHEKDMTRNLFVEEALGWLHKETDRLSLVSNSEAKRNGGGGARILIADDNADMRHYLSRLLSKRWFVVEASNGEEAWNLLQIQTFDLVLCDVMMPLLDGFGLLKKLRADSNLQSIPLILLSARAGEESRIEGLQTGADDYLVKPFSAREVLARIQSHLQIAAIRKAAADDRMASEAKSAFLANMSHEIRTPLGAITGFAELLMNMNLSDKERVEYTEAIRRNGRLLTHIVNDILDFSKVESGMLSIETLNISLTAMLEELATLFSAIASRKGIRFIISSEGTIPKRVATDPTRLQQVLINVIGNAIKFTQKGQVEVFVSAQVKENDAVRLMFRVKDSGLGISPEQKKRLFQAFVQADVSTTRNFGGTGLGLVLARKLAIALGGDVELVESDLGQGSTFLISLETKVLNEEAETSEDKGRYAVSDGGTEPPKHLRGMRILLVDDGPDMRFLMSQILEAEGAIVVQAENGRQGIDKALAEDFDIVLMDMQMPVCDGFAATAELRKSGYMKPIFALSAAVMNAERQRALEAGCDDHFTKPVNVAYLVEKLASYVDGGYKSVELIERDSLLHKPFPKASGDSLGKNSGLS